MRLSRGIAAVIIIAVLCLAILLSAGIDPARADGPQGSSLPYSTSWGNSAGRTGSCATSWGKSDTTMGCSGINNNSKCFFLPCKFCRKYSE